MGETTVSSTVIRKEIIEHGDTIKAAELLGRSYMLNALVIHGDERGQPSYQPPIYNQNIQTKHFQKMVFMLLK